LITKSQKSPWFPCVQVACHIPLEKFRWGLQFCFRPRFNWKFAHKVMHLQNHESFKFGNFWDSHLGVSKQNDIWVLALWLDTKNIIREKVVTSLNFKSWWVLWVHVYSWLVHAPKMFRLFINQLVVWFV
jgi:hypothetical protein